MFISEETFFKNAIKAGVITHLEDIDAIQFVYNGFRYLLYYSDYEQGFVCVRRKCKYV